MRQASPEPERWSARPPGGGAAEDRYGDAFRVTAAAPLPSEEAFERVRRTLHRRIPLRPRRLGPVAAVVVMLATGGGAVWGARGLIEARRAQQAEVRAKRTVTGDRSPVRAAAPPAPLPPPAPALVEVPTPAPAQRTAKRPAIERMAVPSVREAALLAVAFRHLRVDRDGATALARLEEHARRFPDGHLQPEAGLARVEALLLLGRRAEAVALLPSLPTSVLPEARRLLDGVPPAPRE
jgi:hypothetical protein